MAEYIDKFIVINRKKFEQLYQHPDGEFAIDDLQEALNNFKEALIYHGIDNSQKYYVVNQDEPYADEILKIILENETKKEIL